MVSTIYISNKKNFVPCTFYSTIQEYCDRLNGDNINELDNQSNNSESNTNTESDTNNESDNELDDVSYECVERFDNMTGYFCDLGYWDPYIDLANKNSVEVRHNIEKSIDTLVKEGVKPAIWDEDGDKDNDWWDGYKTEKNKKAYTPVKLPNEIRKRGLLFHLNVLLETTYKYDETYTFYIL